MSEQKTAQKYTAKQYAKFIIPSIIGVVLMLLPIPYNGNWTLMYGVICGKADGIVAPIIDWVILAIFAIAVILSVVAKLAKPKWITENRTLNNIFNISPVYLVIRIVALVFVACVQFGIGPEAIASGLTGGTAYGLIKTIVVWMFLGSFFIIFLMDFGIMDLVGTLITRIMRPLFTLPGRSTLDCLASWLGSGTTGVLVTTIQYNEGYYTTREACIVATCFSTVSLSFTLVMSQVVGLEHLFLPVFLTVTAIVFLCAVVLPRIYPLRKKPDEYYAPVGKKIAEDVPQNVTRFQWGLRNAIAKSDDMKSVGQFFGKGLNTAANVWFDLCPMVMVIATAGLIVAEFTPVFHWISAPLVPLLNLLGIPEAAAAAPAMLVGFADQFIPIAMGANIASEFTRFFILCVAISQLIYMSEIGAILLRSNIKISLWNLFVVFIERTIIAIPVAILVGRFVLGLS